MEFREFAEFSFVSGQCPVVQSVYRSSTSSEKREPPRCPTQAGPRTPPETHLPDEAVQFPVLRSQGPSWASPGRVCHPRQQWSTPEGRVAVRHQEKHKTPSARRRPRRLDGLASRSLPGMLSYTTTPDNALLTESGIMRHATNVAGGFPPHNPDFLGRICRSGCFWLASGRSATASAVTHSPSSPGSRIPPSAHLRAASSRLPSRRRRW